MIVPTDTPHRLLPADFAIETHRRWLRWIEASERLAKAWNKFYRAKAKLAEATHPYNAVDDLDAKRTLNRTTSEYAQARVERNEAKAKRNKAWDQYDEVRLGQGRG